MLRRPTEKVFCGGKPRLLQGKREFLSIPIKLVPWRGRVNEKHFTFLHDKILRFFMNLYCYIAIFMDCTPDRWCARVPEAPTL